MLHSVAHGHDPLFVYLCATMMNRARELEADSHRSNICIQILSSVSQSIQSVPIFHHQRQPGVYRRLDVYPPLLRASPTQQHGSSPHTHASTSSPSCCLNTTPNTSSTGTSARRRLVIPLSMHSDALAIPTPYTPFVACAPCHLDHKMYVAHPPS